MSTLSFKIYVADFSMKGQFSHMKSFSRFMGFISVISNKITQSVRSGPLVILV